MTKQVNGKGYLFLSQKLNNKTDPLTFKEKQDYLKIFYPELVIGDAGVKTIIQALQKIQAEGRTKLIMVAGSDRVEEFQKLLNLRQLSLLRLKKELSFFFNLLQILIME